MRRKILAWMLVAVMVATGLPSLAETYNDYDVICAPVEPGEESGNTEHLQGLNVLMQTLDSSVGMQGFEGDYAITSPDEIIEIIVQFRTPPSVALRLMEEQGISPFGEAPSGTYDERALSGHDAFNRQLGDMLVPFGDVSLETFSEHHRLFNGVFMRVPGGMVSAIATLPEVYAVTPNIAFYPDSPGLSDSFFINPQFMRTVREYFGMDEIHEQFTGAGVRVGVLDSGIYHGHPELVRFLDPNTGRIRGGRPNFDNTASLDPAHTSRNHGTTVSGAVIGIAPGIELWNYRLNWSTAGPGGMTAIAAIEAAHEDGMRVINMSFGTSGRNHPFTAIGSAINLAVMDGMVAISSAGNDGRYGSFTVTSPGPEPLLITVGMGNAGSNRPDPPLPADNIRSRSSRGPVVETFHIKPDIIAASGVLTTTLGGGYVQGATGTSHAAPIIAGIAALLFEAFPNAAPYEIKAKIMNTARPLADYSNSVFNTGAGFVRLREALNSDTLVTVQHPVPLGNSRVAPFVLTTMSSLSFGGINTTENEYMNDSMTVSISNRGSTARNFEVLYHFENNPSNDAALDFSRTSITVSPGAIGTFDVTMSIPLGAEAGFYEGFITVNEDAVPVARLPFAAVVYESDFVAVSTEYELRRAVADATWIAPTIIELTADVYLTDTYAGIWSDRRLIITTEITLYSSQGHTITATGDFDAVRVNGSLTLAGVNIMRTQNSNGRGMDNIGIIMLVNGAIHGHDNGMGFGGGVRNTGTFVMQGGEISGNSAREGAGVQNQGGMFTLKSGIIYNNHAVEANGGGVMNTGYGAVFTMTGGEIRGNSTIGRGGGVRNSVTSQSFTLYGGDISENTAYVEAGGVSNVGTFIMHGGKISDNTAYGSGNLVDGGGVHNRASFTMYGGEITENIAGRLGGGVTNSTAGNFVMHGGTISGNRVNGTSGGGIFTWGYVDVRSGTISNNSAATNGGGIGINAADLRTLGRLLIGADAVFYGNSAGSRRHRAVQDDELYYAQIHATNWTYPFTQGFNNYDISGTGGVAAFRYLSFETGDTATIMPPIWVIANTPVMQSRSFPAEPFRTGHTFAGWYMDSNFTTPLPDDFNMPNSNVTIFAKWISTSLSVYLNPGSGLFTAPHHLLTAEFGESIGILPQMPTAAAPDGIEKPGYRFTGWFTDTADETTRWRYNTPVTGNVTLHARWEERPDGFQTGAIGNNGRITSASATLLARWLVALPEYRYTLGYFCHLAADLDGDGEVTSADLVLLAQWLVGHNVRDLIAH